MDYDFWGKLLLAGATFQYTHICFGMFRIQSEQKTGQGWATTQSLVDTALNLVSRARFGSEGLRQKAVDDLHAYQRDAWRATGPLARTGLPRDLVLKLRQLQARLRGRIGRLLRGARPGRMATR
jgi:hypothetical protein